MHYSCAISFRHLSTITYIAWFCRKKFRQLDLIEEEGSGDVQLCTNFFHGSYSTNFPSALARTCRVAKNVFIILSPFEEIRNKVLSPLFFPNSRFYRTNHQDYPGYPHRQLSQVHLNDPFRVKIFGFIKSLLPLFARYSVSLPAHKPFQQLGQPIS